MKTMKRCRCPVRHHALCVIYLATTALLATATSAQLSRNPLARVGNGIPGVIEYSPDGTVIAVGETAGVQLFAEATLTLIALLDGHSDEVTDLAFSPNGKLLVSASIDGTVVAWDVASKTQLASLDGHKDRVTSVAFDPSGSRVATASYDATVRL